jgi:hypothetical protein
MTEEAQMSGDPGESVVALMALTPAMRDVFLERKRQIEPPPGGEGFSLWQDDFHHGFELARAGVAYVVASLDIGRYLADYWWPSNWRAEMFKPGPPGAQREQPKGIRRNLVRAAALLIAEIERLDRAAAAAAAARQGAENVQAPQAAVPPTEAAGEA